MAYTSDKRLYLTADGAVVDAGDPRAATLLVGAGCDLSDDEAARHGLTKPAQAKAQAPAEDKAVKGPREKAGK